MGIFGWLKRSKNKSQQTSGASLERQEPNRTPPIDRVSFGYKPQTASKEDMKIFVSEEDAKTYLRKTCKFIDYMIEGIRVVGVDKKDRGCIYEVYNCNSRTTALQFLSAIPQSEIPPLYYVIVETPFGNLGKDLNGMFDESTGNSIV
jgi:hypothetical protein